MKKILDRIKKCVYYSEKEVIQDTDEHDGSKLIYIGFDVPYNDLMALISVVKKENAIIELSKDKLLITEGYKQKTTKEDNEADCVRKD